MVIFHFEAGRQSQNDRERVFETSFFDDFGVICREKNLKNDVIVYFFLKWIFACSTGRQRSIFGLFSVFQIYDFVASVQAANLFLLV